MQKTLLALILFISMNSFSQTFTEFNADDFSIQFPIEWIKVPKERMPDLALVVYRKPESATDKAQVTMNLNIFSTPNSSLDKTYSNLMSSLKDTGDFTLLKEGKNTISNQAFKWLVESHANDVAKTQQMSNFVFVAYKNDKTYILTFACFTEVFDKYKPVFDKMAESFVIK